MRTGNLFENTAPPLKGERFDTLLRHKNLMVERIVSSSSITPQHCVQPHDEWVVLVQGEATLRVAGESVELKSGDYLFLPAGTPHTVERVSQRAIWLVVHLHPQQAAPDLQTTTQAAAEEDAIRAIHQRMIDAWNTGDSAAFAAPFTDNADFVAFEGTHLNGRREIASFHQRIFDTVVKGSRLKGEVKFVRFLSPVFAVMHSLVSVTLSGQSAASPSRDSMQLTVVTKRGGEWRGEGLMNARRLTMERQFFLDDIDSLPPEAQRQVSELVASLKKRHLKK
jgi:uncharacterized protein (TIGR02246 family)